MTNTSKSQSFHKQILEDVDVLARMIQHGAFQSRKPKIGAEQELCLVDDYGTISNINQQLMSEMGDPSIKTELAKFNLEINLEPQLACAEVFSDMELELISYLEKINQTAKKYKTKTYIGGILPTLRYMDLNIENITPIKRYYELVKNIYKHRGDDYELRIQGEDELLMRHDSVFIEAATTSFQIHLEVHPNEFAKMYNIAQLIAAPTLAISANSNTLFRKKLWHETRIALLRQSINLIKTPVNTRDSVSRVSFGDHWLKESVLELFQDDIAKHRILIIPEEKENSLELFQNGQTPNLAALQNYNSTIYRWNRPVYGVIDGVPHLRIENRILPAGPTIADQIANACFWFGLMYGIRDANIDFESKIDFASIKNNFTQAARNSMYSTFDWYDGKSYSAQDLILHKLIPLAAKGLGKLKIDNTDIEFYLNLISERTKANTNGAIWMYKSIKSMTKNEVNASDIYSSIVTFSNEMQAQNLPVHQWEILNQNISMKKLPSEIIIEECMDKNLFTVRPEDIIQLATDMIDWQKIRYILVENEDGQLVGLVSSRNLLKGLNRHVYHSENIPTTIREIMISNPFTISSSAPLSEGLEIMSKYKIGCLPVLENDKLVGIITEQTYLNVYSNMV
jgi:CBS domain-containing protein